MEDEMAEPDPTGALEDSLDEWLGEPIPLEPAGDESDYHLVVAAAPDEDYADALLLRAARLERERDRITTAAQRRIDRVLAWKDDMVAGVETDRLNLRRSLQLFMGRWHRANPKRKTLPLPNGKLQLRAPGTGRLEVTSEHEFIYWAEANGRQDLLRYKPVPNKDALKAVPLRHVRPQETIEDTPGIPELYNVWNILADVEVAGEGGEVVTEQVSIPGVRYVQRVEDRFDFKLPGDENEETEA